MDTKKKKVLPRLAPMPKEVIKIKVNDLLLDSDNPRLGNTTSGANQDAVLEKLEREKNVSDLIESISQNGYYAAEPLLVIEDSKNKGKYIVVEGNRRTAALKILLNEKLKKEYRYSDVKIAKTILTSLEDGVPAQVYSSRSDLWSYLGFRHIKGATPWDPYSKALYIVGLYDSGIEIKEIVERIGDQNSTVVSMFNGLRVLLQAEDNGYISPESMSKFAFSHLYTILGYNNTKKYLGIKIKRNELLKTNPVPSSKLANLKSLIEFIYGDIQGKKKPIVKSQNPDIRRLDAVLGSTKATSELSENVNQADSLENAFLLTGEEDHLLPQLIVTALTKLKKASGNLHLFNGDEVDIEPMLKEIISLSEDIQERVYAKKEKLKKR